MPPVEVLVIIPARGGSKGIPRKNIRPFAGFPLISFSVAAALQSELVTRTIVTTDDEEIAEVSRRYGAEIPFLRPDELAQDQTTDLPVFQHALTWLAEHEAYHPDVVVQLRPTSPVRPTGCVDDAIRLLLANPDSDCVRGVVAAGQDPHKMWRLDPNTKRMSPLLTVAGIKEPYNTPRQRLPPVYWQTGQIDAIRPATILDKQSMSGEGLLALVLDGRYAVDLDTLADWERAEALVLQGALKMVWPGRQPRPMPETVKLLLLDFDGVLTDNRVWVDQDGREMVSANRSDSLGIGLLRRAGIETMVISMETNPVVDARCKKMKVPFIQGVDEKELILKKLLAERKLEPAHVVYLGNDVNDLPCFPLVGWAVAVADAMPEVKRQADFVLTRPGGHAAVRELCDLILAKKGK